MNRYDKLKVALYYFLLGKGYYNAVDAFTFASGYHTSTRKDGITPEFQHQLEIAHFLCTLLPSFIYPEETICAALLHDVTEDYDIAHKIITTRFGEHVGQSVYLLDKNGKTLDNYFQGLADDPIASLVKGADRVHNVQTMVGVFSPEKQMKYIVEVEEHFLPMLKKARRTFAQQQPAYENIKTMLRSQVQLVQYALESSGTVHPQGNSAGES